MLMAASWDPCLVAACVESRGAARVAWPKTTFQPQKGDNRSWAREDPVHRDRIVDLESRNRTIMGTDPGPGRHRPEPAKHGSVACVVMSALCSRDSRVSLLLSAVAAALTAVARLFTVNLPIKP